MSYQNPMPPGPGFGTPPPYHPPVYGAAHPYGGHPEHASAPGARGLNPWVAALLGALAGVALTSLLGAMLWFTTGGPLPWEGMDDIAEDWSGTVEVAADGSVSGPALADAVLETGDGYYVEADCPDTSRVAEGVTTLCQVDDGYDRYRVVVVFLGDRGRFETAEIYGR